MLHAGAAPPPFPLRPQADQPLTTLHECLHPLRLQQATTDPTHTPTARVLAPLNPNRSNLEIPNRPSCAFAVLDLRKVNLGEVASPVFNDCRRDPSFEWIFRPLQGPFMWDGIVSPLPDGCCRFTWWWFWWRRPGSSACCFTSNRSLILPVSLFSFLIKHLSIALATRLMLYLRPNQGHLAHSSFNQSFIFPLCFLSCDLHLIPCNYFMASKSFLEALSDTQANPVISPDPNPLGSNVGKATASMATPILGSGVPPSITDKGKTKLDANIPSVDENTTPPTAEIDHTDFYTRLAQLRNKSIAANQHILLCSLFGGYSDFNELRNKLRAEWRRRQVNYELVEREDGWFDARFGSATDLKKVWDERPYHLFGQILVLHKWYPSFDPLTAYVTHLDIWVRIPKLPVEYMCREAIIEILSEFNGGSLIRLDKLSHQRVRLDYTRFCANVDFNNLCGTISVLGEDDLPMSLQMYYEDFPLGCGFCGELDHVYEDCPNRIVFVKPLSEVVIWDSPSAQASNDDDGWTRVSKKGSSAESSTKHASHKPYMMGMASVKVRFAPTARSSVGVHSPPKNDAPLSPTKAIPPSADFGLPASDDDTLGWCKEAKAAAVPNAAPTVGTHRVDVDSSMDVDQPVPLMDPATGRTVIFTPSDESYIDKPSMSPTQSHIRRFKNLGIRSSGGAADVGKRHGHTPSDDSATSYPKKRKN